MAITVKHRFTSAKVDTLDNSRIQPSNWNDTHAIQCAGGVVLGRTAGAGQADVTELPMGATGQTLIAAATAAAARAAIVADDSLTTINAAALKATPVDADWFSAIDSAAGNIFKRVTWASIKATLLAYLQPTLQTAYDLRYSLLGHTHTFASLTAKPTTLAGYGITDGLNMKANVPMAGVATEFTGIPAGVKEVTLAVKGGSFNANSNVIFQLGTGAGYVVAGYDGVSWAAGGATAFHSTGILTLNTAASDIAHIMVNLKLQNAATNTWSYSVFTAVPGATYAAWGTGIVSLPGALDRARITTSGGVAVADAGDISLQYQ